MIHVDDLILAVLGFPSFIKSRTKVLQTLYAGQLFGKFLALCDGSSNLLPVYLARSRESEVRIPILPSNIFAKIINR